MYRRQCFKPKHLEFDQFFPFKMVKPLESETRSKDKIVQKHCYKGQIDNLGATFICHIFFTMVFSMDINFFLYKNYFFQQCTRNSKVGCMEHFALGPHSIYSPY